MVVLYDSDDNETDFVFCSGVPCNMQPSTSTIIHHVLTLTIATNWQMGPRYYDPDPESDAEADLVPDHGSGRERSVAWARVLQTHRGCPRPIAAAVL